MSQRPNILHIHTDSQDGRVLGCMDHPAMLHADGTSATPNIDRLAEHGMLFRTMYSNNPICCPSRASMLSGRYTFNCEGWNNYKGLEPDDETWFDRLDGGGYQIGRFGKEDWLSGSHSIRARVSAWMGSANIMKPHYRMGPPRVDDTDEKRVHTRDWDNVDGAVAFMKDHAGAEEPFFTWVGIRQPHPAFHTSNYWLDRINADAITIPELGESDDHPAMFYQRVNKNWRWGFDDETVRRVRHIYYAQIAEVDGMVGDLMKGLEESGAADNTYVIFSSDHGELALEHGQFYKMSHFEGSARVPLIITGPGVVDGVETQVATSLIDLHPTVMDMAGLPQSELADGHSLMAEVTGGEPARPDWVLSESHDTSLPTSSFMLRRGSWKLIRLPGFEPQLFNLDDDPNELKNLAEDQPDVLRELTEQLREVVDERAVAAKVKEYDKASFRQWRAERKEAGDYRELMARLHTGWDDMDGVEPDPWTDTDEMVVERWLNG